MAPAPASPPATKAQVGTVVAAIVPAVAALAAAPVASGTIAAGISGFRPAAGTIELSGTTASGGTPSSTR